MQYAAQMASASHVLTAITRCQEIITAHSNVYHNASIVAISYLVLLANHHRHKEICLNYVLVLLSIMITDIQRSALLAHQSVLTA